MAVGRVKQNIWRESWVGGDRDGRRSARPPRQLAGRRRLHLRDVAVSRRQELSRRRLGPRDRARRISAAIATAHGFKIDYPNDLWDIAADRTSASAATSIRRSASCRGRAVYLYNGQINNRTRLARGPIQQLFHEFEPSLATDLSGHWESYRVFIAPVNWRFRSGDRVRVQRQSDRRAAGRAVRGRRRRRHPARARTTGVRYRLEVGHGAEAPALLAGHVVVRRVLRRRSRSDRCGPAPGIRRRSSRSSSPASATSGGSPTGRLHADAGRQPAARQRLAGSVDRQLRAVRHRQRFGRRQHAAALDVHARSADLFVVYNHNIRDAVGSLAARFQSAADQAGVRLSLLIATDAPPRRAGRGARMVEYRATFRLMVVAAFYGTVVMCGSAAVMTHNAVPKVNADERAKAPTHPVHAAVSWPPRVSEPRSVFERLAKERGLNVPGHVRQARIRIIRWLRGRLLICRNKVYTVPSR